MLDVHGNAPSVAVLNSRGRTIKQVAGGRKNWRELKQLLETMIQTEVKRY